MARRKTVSERLDVTLAKAIASIDTAEFPKALTAFVRECTPFDNFIVIAYNGERAPAVIYRQSKSPLVYEAMDTEYVTGAFVLDPFYEAHLKGVRTGIHRLFDIAPDRFRQTGYFSIYYENTTLIDELAVFAKTSSGGTLTACIGTDKSSGRSFSKKDIASIGRYSFVISSLIQSHWGNYNAIKLDKKIIPTSTAERLRENLKQAKDIRLTSRQAEVALFILQGHSSRSISLIFGISVNTVKIFRRQLYAKCDISSQADLFAKLLPLLSN